MSTKRGIDLLLVITCVLQLIFLISLALSLLCPNIIFLRQFMGFLYLTFTPGILILRIFLKDAVRDLNQIEFIVYSVGLSLSFLMFLGFLINMILSCLLNACKPFSEISLLIAVYIATLILWLLNYYKSSENVNYLTSIYKFLKSLESEIALLYLPFLSIFSIYLINYYNENIMALLLIVVISLIPILVAFNKIPNRSLPVAVWSISVSLLLLNSLLGKYFRPTDNLVEYYFSNLVIKNGFWDHTLPNNINAMLGVVIVLPIYSLICSISLNLAYKIVVPLIFSLVPMGLYEAFKRVTDEKIAFFSSSFFISMYEFYTWFGLTMKMVTASFFLMLLILLLTDEKLDDFNKIVLSIIFAFSLSVSHYGTSYIFMFCLIGAFIATLLLSRQHKYLRSIWDVGADSISVLLSPTFIILYIVFTISWYIYNSSSSPYDTMVNIGRHMVESIIKEYILPEESYGYQIIKGELPTYLQILKILYIISTIFITVGLLKEILKPEFKFSQVYIIFSIFFYITGGSIFLGGLSGAATPDRIYQIISFFLAPFCIIGGTKIVSCIVSLLRKISFKKGYNQQSNSLKIFSIFLVTFLLFNSCFAAEVIWKYNVGPVVSISKPRIINNGSINEKEYFDRVYLSECDIDGALWISSHLLKNDRIYCGVNGKQNLLFAGLTPRDWKNKIGSLNVLKLYNDSKKIYKNSYIYLTKFNTETKKIKLTKGAFPKLFNITDISSIFNTSSKIYTNGKCEIYYYH